METTKKTTTVSPHAGGSLVMVRPGDMTRHADIIYRDLDTAHVKSLRTSIAANGLNVPLTAWNGGGPKGAVVKLGTGDAARTVPATFLLSGSHRLAAIRELRTSDPAAYNKHFAKGIPCYVVSGELKDALLTVVRTNVHSKDPSYEELFPLVKRLMAKGEKGFGMTQKEVATQVGKSAGWLSQVLSVEESLGEEGAEALKTGDLKLSQARKLASDVKKAAKAGKPADAKAALKAVVDANKKRKSEGKDRAERRVSAATLYKRFLGLPRMTLASQNEILLSALAYLAKDPAATLPDELAGEDEGGEPAPAPKKGVKAVAKDDADEDDDNGGV